ARRERNRSAPAGSGSSDHCSHRRRSCRPRPPHSRSARGPTHRCRVWIRDKDKDNDTSACGPREDRESSSAEARSCGGGAPRAVIKDDGTVETLINHRALRVAFGLLVSGALCTRGPAIAQHAEGSLPQDFNEPIGLYKTALGKFDRPISSSTAEAQAYFNQG